MSGVTEEEDSLLGEESQHLDSTEKVDWSDFNKRVCKKFVAAEKTNGEICCCGYEKSPHQSLPAASCELHAAEMSEWTVEQNTEAEPTDAFGEIEFVRYHKKVSKGRANFVRIDYNTTPDSLLKLLKTKWGLTSPNLLISVVGGAKLIKLDPRMREEIGRGLVKAAEKTGAWIITGGMDTGVMKLVGDAIRDDIYTHGTDKPVVALGVASWGCVANKESLIKEGGSWPAKYEVAKGKDKTCSLDPNHSHFILVDNGTQHQFGVEISLRSQLESAIKSNGKDGVSTPAVMLVVEGDFNTLVAVKDAINSGIPAIIIEGSGGAADVLTHAYNRIEETENMDSIALDQEIRKKVGSKAEKAFGNHELNCSIQFLRDCLEKKDHMTVISMDDLDSVRDIDLSILRALIKVKKADYFDKLHLALCCDRVDEARRTMFHEGFELQEPEKLKDLMFEAMQSSIHEFVELFIESGYINDSFEDKTRLTKLYSEKKNEIDWADVTKLIMTLRGDPYYPLRYDAEDNARDYFLWAALTSSEEMASVLWKETKEPIAAALTASLLLKNLSQKTDDGAKKMLSMAKTIEERASGFLTECFATDERKCKLLLVRGLPAYGEASCILLAMDAKNKTFISHEVCRPLLKDIWMGNLAQSTQSTWLYSKMWLSVLFPPLLLLLIKFRQKDNSQPTSGNEKHSHHTAGLADEQARPRVKSKNNMDEPDRLKKIIWFYEAPVIKFLNHSIAHIAFLALFSIIMLTDFNPDVTVKEMVLMAWVFTFFLDEIHQVCVRQGNTICSKLQPYISEVWNFIDVAALLLFLNGATLRFIPSSVCKECFETARIVLVLSLITFYIRALRMVAVHEKLGPKLVTIGRMMCDLYFFFVILMIFILAYGVAVQALLYPNSPLDTDLMQDVLRKPYWKMYAELFLEEVEGQLVCTHDPLLWKNNTLPRCASNTNVLPIFLGVYVLITNILMLNLLIAMFSCTFEAVQKKSGLHWTLQQFSLTRDYVLAPSLAPPFNIVSLIYSLCKYLNKMSKKTPKLPFFIIDEKESDKIRELDDWEKALVDDYYKKAITKKHESSDYKIDDTFNRIKDMTHRVEKLEYQMQETLHTLAARINKK